MNSKLPSTDSEANSTEIHQGGRLPLSRYALFFLPCVIGLAVDLWTKWYMFTNHFDPLRADIKSVHYSAQEPSWWVDGIFGIQTSTNPGALFGMGSGYSWLFATFSFVALIGIGLWVFVFGAARDRWLTYSLGMICGGILGNLYDRMGLGYLAEYPIAIKNNVRDWILFRLEGVAWFDPWPNFNIADVLLVCGAAMLFIHALVYSEPKPSDDSQE